MVSSTAQRTIIGRIGAFSLHAQGRTNTGPGRKAFLERFEHEVDPDGELEPRERARRAEAARRAYFSRLALKSAKTRQRKARRRKAGRQGASTEASKEGDK